MSSSDFSEVTKAAMRHYTESVEQHLTHADCMMARFFGIKRCPLIERVNKRVFINTKMNVGQLIRKLQKMDPHTKILLMDSEYGPTYVKDAQYGEDGVIIS